MRNMRSFITRVFTGTVCREYSEQNLFSLFYFAKRYLVTAPFHLYGTLHSCSPISTRKDWLPVV